MSKNSIINTLAKCAASASNQSLSALFAADSNRMSRLRVQAPGMVADLSKQKVDEKTLNTLIQFADSCGLPQFFAAMADGAEVNKAEGRAAQHMALRAGKDANAHALGQPISSLVADDLAKMRGFGQKLRRGELTGSTGRPLNTLVHIGIGGSDLGPRFIAQALHRQLNPGITLRFAANLDAADINDALQGCDPETTMIVVVSKTFSTRETLANANVARAWLVQHLGADAPRHHMAAVSTNIEAIAAFGIMPDNVFAMYDWVGGRYSLWSSVGISLMAALRGGAFDELLAGAAAMDEHTLGTPLEKNAPFLSALVQFWNRNFLNLQARAIAPYASRLALLPSYLQQLIMESNGKTVGVDGKPAAFAASPVIFGAEGTNAQHAYFQQFHQGPVPVPVDFIGIVKDAEHNPGQHNGVLANMLGQARALMVGKPAIEIAAQLREEGVEESAIERLAAQKTMPGDRPSSTILLDELSPFCLGALLAFYEHETVAQAVLCGINPFDQWGVELGKKLALDLESRLNAHNTDGMDPSTQALMERINRPD